MLKYNFYCIYAIKYQVNYSKWRRVYEKCKCMVIVEPGEGVTICNVRLPVEVPVSKPDSPQGRVVQVQRSVQVLDSRCTRSLIALI